MGTDFPTDGKKVSGWQFGNHSRWQINPRAQAKANLHGASRRAGAKL